MLELLDRFGQTFKNNIKYINMNENRNVDSAFLASIIDKLPNLEKMHFVNCSITYIPKNILSLGNLEDVDFSGNNIILPMNIRNSQKRNKNRTKKNNASIMAALSQSNIRDSDNSDKFEKLFYDIIMAKQI